MRVALAQMGSVPGDFAGTVDRMVQMSEKAVAAGADLVIYPPSLLGGMFPASVAEQPAFCLDMLDAIEEYAAQASVTTVIPAYVHDGLSGYVEVFLCEDGFAGPLRLREMDRGNFEAEQAIASDPCFSVDDVNVVVSVDGVAAFSQTTECDLLVICTSIPFCDDDVSSTLVEGLADGGMRGLVEWCPWWLAVVQGVGGYDDGVLAGGSFAVSPEGEVRAACPCFEESLVTFDVPSPMNEPATFSVAPAAKEMPAQPGDKRFVGRALDELPSTGHDRRLGLLWSCLVTATRDYVRKSGFSDVLIGLSGGLDSSVVAAIAADALGPEHVRGLLMPGPYSSASSVDDALELARLLGIETMTAPIGDMYDCARRVVGERTGAQVVGLTQENLQARLRGLMLMTLSNAQGSLVLNTGNKSESAMGYSTLYGDTVGAYAPLADVYKTRVFELARWRNEQSLVIPENVLVKPPSAELSEGQTDEGSFGLGYDRIDQILYMHVERGMDAADIIERGFGPDEVYKVLDACRRSEFKRRQEPMGPVVSLAPFVDRGWPVVLGWRDRSLPRRDSSEGADLAELLGLVSVESASEEGREMHEEELVSPVADRLEKMLSRLAHQDVVMGTLGDVVYGAVLSGRGPDMDDMMGVPLFSKN